MHNIINTVSGYKYLYDYKKLLNRFMDIYIAIAFGLYLLAYQWSKILFDALGIVMLLLLAWSLIKVLFGKQRDYSSTHLDFKSPFIVWACFLLVSFFGFFIFWGHLSWQWSGWMEMYFLSILNALLFVVYWYHFPESGKKQVAPILIALPILNGLGALYEFYVLLNKSGRVELQFSYPVLYGGMGFVAVSLVSILTFSQTKWVRYMGFIAIAIGSIGVLLSGTRSASLGLIVLLLLLSFFHLYKGSLRKSMAIALLFVVVAICFGKGFHSVIQKRWDDTLHELQQIKESEGAVATSINTRVSFWKTAWVLLDHRPLIGLSVDDMKHFIKDYNAQFEYKKFDGSANHPHADILVGWYAGGLLGVLFLMALYGFPLWFAKRYCNKHSGLLACAFVVSFAAVGLADAYFLKTVTIKFYMCFLTLLLLLGLKHPSVQ